MTALVAAGGEDTQAFRAGEAVSIPFEAVPGQDLEFELAVYYYPSESRQVCLIHTSRLAVPVETGPPQQTSAQVGFAVGAD